MCLVKAAMGWKKICLVCVSVSILKGQHVSFCVTRCVGQRERLLLSRGKWRITWCTAYLAPDPCFMSLFFSLAVCVFVCVSACCWCTVMGIWLKQLNSAKYFWKPKWERKYIRFVQVAGSRLTILTTLSLFKKKEKKKKMLFYYKVFFSSLLNGNISHTCRETMWSKD